MLRTNDALILDEEPGWFLFGSYLNTSVVVWRRQANEEALRRFGLAIEGLQAKYPAGRSSIQVVVEGTRPATAGAQRAFAGLMSHSQLACAAAVYLGSGFWASTLLSSITTIAMRAARQLEFRQHRTIEELDWLAEKHSELTGVRLRPERLVAVVHAFLRESEPVNSTG